MIYDSLLYTHFFYFFKLLRYVNIHYSNPSWYIVNEVSTAECSGVASNMHTSRQDLVFRRNTSPYSSILEFYHHQPSITVIYIYILVSPYITIHPSIPYITYIAIHYTLLYMPPYRDVYTYTYTAHVHIAHSVQ